MENSIEENNKLIAEFMGLVKSSIEKMYWSKKSEEGFGCGELVELKYHTSWDWLMPVVNKIRNVTSYDRDMFSTEVIICGDKTTIKSKGYGEKEHSSRFFNKSFRGKHNSREATYKEVVEYIKWYNESKTK